MIRKKIVLLGDVSVGKTSLTRRFVHDTFDDHYITTIGTKVSRRQMEFEHQGESIPMDLQVWDVFGQLGYTGVQHTSLMGAAGAILVCDGTQPDSLLTLSTYWLPLLYEHSWNIPIFIVANKNDLADFSVDESDLEGIAWLHTQCYPSEVADAEVQRAYGTASAKTGEGVDDLFNGLCRMMLMADTVSDPIMSLLHSAVKRDPPIAAPEDPKSYLDWLIMDYMGGRFDNALMYEARVEIVRAGLDLENPMPKKLETLVIGLKGRELERLDPQVARERESERRSHLERILGESGG